MNSWELSFGQRLFYGSDSAITVPVTLFSSTHNLVQIRPKLDTGSDYCIFRRTHAELLELDVESGVRQMMATATGTFPTWGHEVTITVLGLEWQAVVYFAESDDFRLNVLGRQGFLDRVRLGLVDYEQLLYLSSYQDT